MQIFRGNQPSMVKNQLGLLFLMIRLLQATSRYPFELLLSHQPVHPEQAFTLLVRDVPHVQFLPNEQILRGPLVRLTKLAPLVFLLVLELLRRTLEGLSLLDEKLAQTIALVATFQEVVTLSGLELQFFEEFPQCLHLP